jgi:hypothetical protein
MIITTIITMTIITTRITAVAAVACSPKASKAAKGGNAAKATAKQLKPAPSKSKAATAKYRQQSRWSEYFGACWKRDRYAESNSGGAVEASALPKAVRQHQQQQQNSSNRGNQYNAGIAATTRLLRSTARRSVSYNVVKLFSSFPLRLILLSLRQQPTECDHDKSCDSEACHTPTALQVKIPVPTVLKVLQNLQQKLPLTLAWATLLVSTCVDGHLLHSTSSQSSGTVAVIPTILITERR